MTAYAAPEAWVSEALQGGLAIPAHPLALDRNRKLDERRQRALTRYYHAAGACGLAVGVHTTQFEIRKPEHGLLQPVLELVSETAAACDARAGRRTVLIAGICGPTSEAVREAQLAREHGYHAGLLSLAGLSLSDEKLLAHSRVVGREIPLVGFYLQPAVGGRLLSHDFWRGFVEIPSVVAIKVAAFNRYQTLDVVRAVAGSGRAGEIALYTGNDDTIVLDLLTRYELPVGTGTARLGMAGGLLGHWAVWTRRAVEILEECKRARNKDQIPARLLTLAGQVTDSNAALFDAANGFAGCIPGINEMLRRQGLLEESHCLDPAQELSAGQPEELDRVHRLYPSLNDDDFVAAHLEEWLN
jgi:dihydrodipicolinate synthase/N-acetylneuraminate lyase